jgi:hypothetical protein
MSRRWGRRWVAAVAMAALIGLGTFGLFHVYADTHSGDRLSDQCLTCRVVGSSITLASAKPSTAQPVIVGVAPLAAAGQSSAQAFVAHPGSRGPPLLS